MHIQIRLIPVISRKNRFVRYESNQFIFISSTTVPILFFKDLQWFLKKHHR